MTKDNDDVAVVIVTYFTGPSLWDCLRSCLESKVGEIIIVSNGNQKNTLEKLREFTAKHSHAHLCEGHGNIGFSKACNLGAKHAKRPYYMFLNPDAILHQDTLSHLKHALGTRRVPSIAGARLLNVDDTEQRGARRGDLNMCSALVSISGATRFAHIFPMFADMHWENKPLPDAPESVPAISGACMMFRAEDFAHVGGLDERYFLHVEDLDICKRIRQCGGDVVFVPSAKITHIGSTSKANIFRVNWHKSIGLIRYFYRFSNNTMEQTLALVLAPLIIGALMMRTLWLRIKF